MAGISNRALFRAVIILLIVLIVAITVIVLWGSLVPDIFVSLVTLLTGFLVGARSTAIREEEAPPHE